MPNQRKKITDFFQEMDKLMESAVTHEEMQPLLDTVAEFVSKSNSELNAKLEEHKQMMGSSSEEVKKNFQDFQNEVQDLINQVKEEAQSSLTQAMNSLQGSIDNVQGQIPEMPEEMDLTDVYESIKAHELALGTISDLITGENIRNAIEALPQGERFTIESINGLPEALKELERLIQANAVPPTTSFINGQRAKNINFTGATVSYKDDTATVAITGGSGSSWGAITGTLSDQTDLQAVLDTIPTSVDDLGPSQTGNNGKFLTTNGTNASWGTPAGSGDMILASAQTNSGAKTFLDATMLLRNVANTFSSYFTNTNTAARTYTLPDKDGTVAMTSDITGTNSGTNTGDQTISITGDATASGSTGVLTATVTKINGTSLAGLATGILKNTTTTGVPSIAVAGDFPTLNQNTTGSAATLTTPRAIYGNNFDGSAALTQVIASTYGGTGNGFTKFSGPTTSEKTFTLPDANATLLYSGGALGTPSSATLTNATGLPTSGLSSKTGNGSTVVTGTAGTSGNVAKWDANGNLVDAGVAPSTLSSTINFIIDGGGSTITTGVKGDIQIDFACTINSATLLADQTGSIVVNIWNQVYSSFPPTVSQKITASAPPTISSATKSQDTTLTGWTTTISAGDILRFNVDSVSTIQRVTLALKVTRV